MKETKMRMFAWLLPVALSLSSVHPGLAQIEVQQNGDVALGTSGTPVNTTTVNGKLNVTGPIGNPSGTTNVSGDLAVSGSVSTGGAPIRTTILFATGGGQTTQSALPVDMTGLTLSLPMQTSTQSHALVTLNVPDPSANGAGNAWVGAGFGIAVNGTLQTTKAAFTYSFGSQGSVPTTLTILVPLSPSQTTTVQAQWWAIRNSTVTSPSPASISAVVGLRQ